MVVGTDSAGDGFLYAFDRKTGEPRWRQRAAGGFPSAVAAANGRAYAVTMAGEIRCVDLESGESLWTHGGEQGARYLRSSVLIEGDRILASLPSGVVRALDAGTGKQVWETRLPARLNTGLLAVGDRLYVGDVEGTIHRLATADGKTAGTIRAASPLYGSLSFAGGCLLALSAETTLTCFDPDDGSTRWSRESPSIWSSFEPLVLADLVVVGDDAGGLHALRLGDGSTAWTRRVDGEVKGLGADDGRLYVGTSEGRLFSLPLPGRE